ncbi:GRIP domain containing protein [Nitzschia inconspicua]|uniref:GRIP domain containing protein n=1 Tax=Nitzschia inconspicua TaxID=303405 RepID=A0A9K3Q0D3_9STRA|nr:GRIP domain containing protein [Nitzschia inconspicua]
MSDTNAFDNNNGSGSGAIRPGSRPPSAPNSGNSPSPVNVAAPSKVAVQMQKMRDANTKYKNLLKMAKERIEQQEQELKNLKAASEGSINTNNYSKKKSLDEDFASRASSFMDDADEAWPEQNFQIVRVCQCIKVDLEAHEIAVSKGRTQEIWALLEFEMIVDPDVADSAGGITSAVELKQPKRMKQWKRFDAESDLADFIRRDTGEPLTVPPFSLTPQQSLRISTDAEKRVSQITEEFRRFRVKSEMTRKQMDSQIRELQSTNVESAKRRIEGKDVEKEREVARTEHSQLERMRAEMAKQEAQWKESYDLILKENEALKSSGSEALLASQWRQRYEVCLKEKEEAISKLKMAEQRSNDAESEGKYERKYRDLKESFRLYRKKAKEIFEAQNVGANGNGAGSLGATDMMRKISQQSNEESKLSYLKNLMVNYLTSDQEVRDHMEIAIGTVLQFTPDDHAKIKAKKEANESWGIF